MITLDLPYPPSVNGLYVPVRGRLILSKKGRAYHTDVLAGVLEQGQPKAPEGRLCATIDVYPPDRRRRDIANVEKIVLDALQEADVLADDCLIDRLVITRREVQRGGRCVVRISSYTQETNNQ